MTYDPEVDPGVGAGFPVAAARPLEAPTTAELTGRFAALRPPEPDRDAPALFAGSHGSAQAEALWTYLPYGPYDDEAAMRRWLAECAACADPYFRVVRERDAGTPVGMAAYLNVEPEHRRLELGHIWYVPSVQRTRLTTETTYLMLREAFDRLGARRAEWKCDALNARSRRAALRLGFRFEGIFRQHMIVKGRNRDTAWYALVDADWPAVRSNIERWLYGDEPGLSLTELNAPLIAGFHDPAPLDRDE